MGPEWYHPESDAVQRISGWRNTETWGYRKQITKYNRETTYWNLPEIGK